MTNGPVIQQHYIQSFSRIADYLQYRFAGRKCSYARNEFIVPWLIQIPYYIYLGDKRQDSTNSTASISQPANFRLEHGLLTPNSPWQKANAQEDAAELAEFSLGASALDDTTHQSVINRQVVKQRSQSAVSPCKHRGPGLNAHSPRRIQWRLPFEEQEVHKEFRSEHLKFWTFPAPLLKGKSSFQPTFTAGLGKTRQSMLKSCRFKTAIPSCASPARGTTFSTMRSKRRLRYTPSI